MLGLEEHYSPSPLGDFDRLFEGLIGVLFKLWHSNMIYFLNVINMAPKNINLYHWFAGKSKLNAVSTSQSKSKQTWFPWCFMPIGTIQHLNTQSTEFTNSSVLVASVVYGEWRWQPPQKLLNSVFIPCTSASVIECRSIGSCSSSGLCAGLLHDHRFPLSAVTHTASLWHKMPVRGIRLIFKNLCYNTD